MLISTSDSASLRSNRPRWRLTKRIAPRQAVQEVTVFRLPAGPTGRLRARTATRRHGAECGRRARSTARRRRRSEPPAIAERSACRRRPTRRRSRSTRAAATRASSGTPVTASSTAAGAPFSSARSSRGSSSVARPPFATNMKIDSPNGADGVQVHRSPASASPADQAAADALAADRSADAHLRRHGANATADGGGLCERPSAASAAARRLAAGHVRQLHQRGRARHRRQDSQAASTAASAAARAARLIGAASAGPIGSCRRRLRGRSNRRRPPGHVTTRRSRPDSGPGGRARRRSDPGRPSWSRSWSAARFRCSSAGPSWPSLK